jgi:hypothetical protein
MGSEARDPAGGNHKFSAHFRLILRRHFRLSFRSYAADAHYKERVIWTELQRIVPRADLRTCADFGHLEAECCRTCHLFYPHYEMTLFEHSDGG